MRAAVSKVLDRLRDVAGLDGADVAYIVSASPATVSSRSSGEATRDLKTQTVIAQLRRIVDRLAEFYTSDEARLRLHAKHPMLGTARAIDPIASGRAEEALAVVEALRSRGLCLALA